MHRGELVRVLTLVVLVSAMSACDGARPQTAEVTRVVPQTVEVTGAVPRVDEATSTSVPSTPEPANAAGWKVYVADVLSGAAAYDILQNHPKWAGALTLTTRCRNQGRGGNM